MDAESNHTLLSIIPLNYLVMGIRIFTDWKTVVFRLQLKERLNIKYWTS